MTKNGQGVVTDVNRREKLTEALDVLSGMTGETSSERITEIARAALAVSEDCVEAWLVLAQQAADSPEAMRAHLESAVEAGDRLFAERKERLRGKFGALPEAQSYMQARFILGQALWDGGLHAQALEVLHTTLELHEADPQGVRYVLLKAMLDDKLYVDADNLLAQYPAEQSTVILYGRLLTNFVLHGDGLLARSAFLAARKYNPFVLDYLLGLRNVPQKIPTHGQPGDDAEAVRYALVFGETWDKVPGALDFVRTQKRIRLEKDVRKKR